MLVLTRQKGQSVIINDEIELVILSTRGNQIKIGIKAPKEVIVYRGEIHQRIQEKIVANG